MGLIAMSRSLGAAAFFVPLQPRMGLLCILRTKIALHEKKTYRVE